MCQATLVDWGVFALFGIIAFVEAVSGAVRGWRWLHRPSTSRRTVGACAGALMIGGVSCAVIAGTSSTLSRAFAAPFGLLALLCFSGLVLLAVGALLTRRVRT